MTDSTPYSREQQRHLLEVQEVWAQHAALLAESKELAGGMQWKTIRGHEYLYRYGPDPQTRKKRSTSLGRRSQETEAMHEDYFLRRSAVHQSLSGFDETVQIQARVSKALRLNRVDTKVADVLERLAESGLAEHTVLVSEEASWGYETLFKSSLPHPEAPELLFLTLDDDMIQEFIEKRVAAWQGSAMHQVRRDYVHFSFRGQHCRLSTQKAYLERLESMTDNPSQVACIRERLLSPPVPTFAIDRSGRPVAMAIADPIAFAMMMSIALRDDSELAATIVELAVETGQHQFEEHEYDAFPAIVPGAYHYGFRI